MRNRRKVLVRGVRPDVAVPFREVELAAPNDPVRLYDTTGPDADPVEGLPPLRLGWITGRNDVERYAGRPTSFRDDGRAAGRGDRAPAQPFRGEGVDRPRLRAASGRRVVTQLHYARDGEITPEME